MRSSDAGESWAPVLVGSRMFSLATATDFDAGRERVVVLAGTDTDGALRSEDDGRLSVARITRKGLAVLDRVDPRIEALHRAVTSRIGERDARALTRICERLIES